MGEFLCFVFFSERGFYEKKNESKLRSIRVSTVVNRTKTRRAIGRFTGDIFKSDKIFYRVRTPCFRKQKADGAFNLPFPPKNNFRAENFICQNGQAIFSRTR